MNEVVENCSSQNTNAKRLTGYDVLKVCQKKNWFTNGDTHQYNKVIKCADEGADIDHIAYMIWICSTNTTVLEVKAILNALAMGVIE